MNSYGVKAMRMTTRSYSKVASVLSSNSYDVVVAGGGVIGSSCAYFLAKRGNIPAKNILVVERDPTYKYCSTALSAGSIRHQFSTPENIQLSQFGTHFLRNARHYLGEDSNVSLTEGGYLFLAATEEGREVLKGNHRLQTSLGSDIVFMKPDELRDEFKWLNTSDIVAGTFGRSGEGWLDPYSLLMAFRNAAQQLGVNFVQDTVVGVNTSTATADPTVIHQSHGGKHVTGVTLKQRGDIGCGVLIDSMGSQSAVLTRMVGVDIPVRARKRCVFVVKSQDSKAVTRSPLVIDPSGVYWRPESSGNFICGVSPPEHKDPDVAENDFEVDHSLFEEVIWPAMAHRVPSAFEGMKVVGSWAGHYDYNTFDQNAILGPLTTLPNFYLATGFSGS